MSGSHRSLAGNLAHSELTAAALIHDSRGFASAIKIETLMTEIETAVAPLAEAKLVMSPEQCRMARAGLSITTRDLADAAHVSISTITRFESGQTIPSMTVALFQKALERQGVDFVAEGPKVGLWMTGSKGA